MRPCPPWLFFADGPSSSRVTLAACSSSSPAATSDAGKTTPADGGKGTSRDAHNNINDGGERKDSRSTGGDTGTGPGQCGAVGVVPPTVTARNALTGALLCDVVVYVVADGGAVETDAGSVGFPCETDYGGCPSAPADGGAESCVLSFGGAIFPGSQTIEVTAAGFEPKIVHGVMSGVTGCVAMPTPGTQVEVSLTPAPDADAQAPLDAKAPTDAKTRG